MHYIEFSAELCMAIYTIYYVEMFISLPITHTCRTKLCTSWDLLVVGC